MYNPQMELLTAQIETHLQKIFPSYWQALDDSFVRDMMDDVIETSAFQTGEYSEDDISLAFQRVALGRMGNAEWSKYKKVR